MTWLRAIAVWLLIILAESLHGTLRQLFLAPAIGDFRARQVAVFTGILVIFAITWLGIRWLRARSRRELLATGALWVLLTAAFEVTLGLALGYDRDRILQDYDLPRGGLMGIGLVALLFMPLAAARLRGCIEQPPVPGGKEP